MDNSYYTRRLPFLLTPATKDYMWGGRKLRDDFNKNIDFFPLAETWECSTHVDGQSMVEDMMLGEILKANPDWLGSHPPQIMNGKPELPILIKLIDAKENLSVQVHPDDEYARDHENGSLGKIEMWYVLSARKDSELVYGFRRNMTKEDVRKAIECDKIGQYLNHVPVEKDDVFFVDAGTVHAIGAGCIVAEIQESSNITYRLYDYNRKDGRGCKRSLNIEKALDVANLNSEAIPRQPIRVLKYRNGFASEVLCRSKYFHVERVILNTEMHRNLVEYRTESNSFHALLCIDGCGCMSNDGFILNFFKGDCIFVPADSEVLKLHGRAQILDVSC